MPQVQDPVKEKTRARAQLQARYSRVRQTTEFLCHPLEKEDFVVQPIEDVSPPKWHLAHTTWFFETNLLKKFTNKYRSYHSRYNYLFNSYYESFGVRTPRPKRGDLSRPTVEQIYDYRRVIDEKMQGLMSNISEKDWPELARLVSIGLHHEQQHQELLVTDIKYILGHNPLRPTYSTADSTQALSTSTNGDGSDGYTEVDGGLVTVGYNGKSFAWDNEKPTQKVHVKKFKIKNKLVTNGEYLEFIKAGGYKDFRLWLSDGWDQVQKENWKGPMYWEKEGSQWYVNTLKGFKEINLHEPVSHVSFYEADAFARWAQMRLPTEFEWEHTARQQKISADEGNFLDDHNFHPLPSHPSPKKDSSAISQMLGDVWEWTQSAYLPYSGYVPEEGALAEYNGKFMSNQMVLRGGSCATPREHIRITYRNFFQAEKRWQFTGIRLASD